MRSRGFSIQGVQARCISSVTLDLSFPPVVLCNTPCPQLNELEVKILKQLLFSLRTNLSSQSCAFERAGLGVEPCREPGRMPMEHEVFEEGPAQRHDEPVAVKRAALSRRRYIIERVAAVAKSRADCAQSGGQ